MLLWIAAATAAPLDDALADGRPVIVLVDRADAEPFGVWLHYARGAARERIHAVALALVTPHELAAWTGAPVPETADLVRLDPAGRVVVYADVADAPPPWTGAVDAGPADAAPPRTGAAPRRSAPTAHPSNRTARLSPSAPARDVRDYVSDVVRSYDRALATLLRRLPLPAATADAPHPTSPHPAVHGATWCEDTGCGIVCDRSTPPEPITITVFNPETGETEITGYVPSAVVCGVGYLEPEIAMFLRRWDDG